MPLALGGDHTMTYPILQAIKVHACANNTDRMYTLCFRGDHTMTYPILQAIKVHVSTNNTDMMYTLSFRWRPHYDLSYTPGY